MFIYDTVDMYTVFCILQGGQEQLAELFFFSCLDTKA